MVEAKHIWRWLHWWSSSQMTIKYLCFPLGVVKEIELGNWIVRASLWAHVCVCCPRINLSVLYLRNIKWLYLFGLQLEDNVVIELMISKPIGMKLPFFWWLCWKVDDLIGHNCFNHVLEGQCHSPTPQTLRIFMGVKWPQNSYICIFLPMNNLLHFNALTWRWISQSNFTKYFAYIYYGYVKNRGFECHVNFSAFAIHVTCGRNWRDPNEVLWIQMVYMKTL